MHEAVVWEGVTLSNAECRHLTVKQTGRQHLQHTVQWVPGTARCTPLLLVSLRERLGPACSYQTCDDVHVITYSYMVHGIVIVMQGLSQ